MAEPLAGTKEVTSLQNPLVKLIRALEMRKVRREHGLFVAEGAKVVATARDCGWVPRKPTSMASAPIDSTAPASASQPNGAFSQNGVCGSFSASCRLMSRHALQMTSGSINITALSSTTRIMC